MRVSVRPELLRWARERAGQSLSSLSKRFPRLAEWEQGTAQPTLNQLQAFARAVHVPIGYLFLPEPPQETLPLPDFRTLTGQRPAHPSPELLDTIYLCQQRQAWYREYARLQGLPKVAFIGSAQVGSDTFQTAAAMRHTLGISVEERLRLPSWTHALRQLIDRAEAAGVLVMFSSVVGANSRRKLRIEEFRGFALVDEFAPLIFINAADSKAAQQFTLAHELVHLWIGQSGISDVDLGQIPIQSVERWCNAVAAELLVPLDILQAELGNIPITTEEIQRLARHFKVSSLVILRRLLEADLILTERFHNLYQKEVVRLRNLQRADGGDFYSTLTARTGKRFAQAVVTSALEGHTLLRDALRMLGIRKVASFYALARKMQLHTL